MTTLRQLSSALGVLGLAVLAGCAMAPSLTKTHSSGTGAAQVTITGWSHRTAQATAADVSTVSLKVVPNGGNPALGRSLEIGRATSGSATASFSGLAAGSWRLQAQAIGIAGQLGAATADVTIVAGETAQVSMPIRLVSTNGLQLQVGIEIQRRRWNKVDREAKEPQATGFAFEDTVVDNAGEWWAYRLSDSSGTRLATYSVITRDAAARVKFLEVAIRGYAPYELPLGIPDNDLNTMPGSAVLMATGSEMILGGNHPFREYRFLERYPFYEGGKTVYKHVLVNRWVAPGVGIYREEAEVFDPLVEAAGATSSMVLTGTSRPFGG